MFQDTFTLVNWWRTSVILEKKNVRPSFKEGELWWCSIGMNIGVEIFGKGADCARPVVIFKKFNADSLLGIPLTTKPKEGAQYVRTTHGGKER
jgi:mRNA interferase MazF